MSHIHSVNSHDLWPGALLFEFLALRVSCSNKLEEQGTRSVYWRIFDSCPIPHGLIVTLALAPPLARAPSPSRARHHRPLAPSRSCALALRRLSRMRLTVPLRHLVRVPSLCAASRACASPSPLRHLVRVPSLCAASRACALTVPLRHLVRVPSLCAASRACALTVPSLSRTRACLVPPLACTGTIFNYIM